MGEREINGDATVEIIAPDKIKRTEEMGIQGGPTFSRTVALDGSDYWEDTTNRGGGGFMRFGGPGGPGGPGGGQGPSEADRERFRQMAQRRLKGELQRYLLVWLMRTDAPDDICRRGRGRGRQGGRRRGDVRGRHADARVLRSEDAPAADADLPGRAAAHDRPPGWSRRPGGNAGPPPDAEEMRRRMAEPPKIVTFEVRFSEFKNVSGVMLPHQMSQSVEGKPTEEWTVSQFKVNPNLKPESFAKKNKS